MDTTEIVILKWLDKQASPRTTSEVHQQFSKSLSLAVVDAALNSLLKEEKVEKVMEGFREAWRSRGIQQ